MIFELRVGVCCFLQCFSQKHNQPPCQNSAQMSCVRLRETVWLFRAKDNEVGRRKRHKEERDSFEKRERER